MDFTSKPTYGFVLGKFMCPTTGHKYLCDFAKEYCERLTILVCSLPDEPIPGKLRFEWMKEMYPDCRVIWCDKVLPQEPKDENDTEFWTIWKETIREYTGLGVINTVFASENYGERLAKELGAEFVPCDINRTFQECSGTKVRNNPFKMWDFIPQVVRSYYTKRICLFGPESSGKSTLAKELAKHYNTVCVPEYGRVYTEFFGADVDENGIGKIVQGHLASVKAAKKHANKLLIEDTDPVMSAVWSDMLTGKRDKWFDEFNDHADIYLLCDIDIPWVDDGTRYFPKEEDRKRFFSACENELIKRKVNYHIVSGDLNRRMRTSVNIIDLLIFSR